MSTRKQADNPEAEMSFWSHLEALRAHLIRSILVIVLLTIISFFFKNFIFDYIVLAPKEADFISNRAFIWLARQFNTTSGGSDFNLEIISIRLSGQFLMHLYISFVFAIIVGAPYLIFELWLFIKPALSQRERMYSRGAVIVTSLLFYVGVLFSYFLIVPLTLHFLGSYSISASVINQINLNSYISTVLSLTLSLGIVFELPVMIFFLSKAGIVTPAFLQRNRKIMMVVILILAAIITPPDVISQVLVAFPLMVLYEISILIAKQSKTGQ